MTQSEGARPAWAAGLCPVTSQEGTERQARSEPRLSVAVLVDLEWSDKAGGHVKCWERVARAAATGQTPVDLTLHVQGRQYRRIDLGPSVRVVTHRPLLSSAGFGFLADAPDQSDLAPLHPRLLADLAQCDVVHTTDAYFAFAKTARLAAALFGKALVNSLHTDTPAYTRIYAEKAIRRLFGSGRCSDLLVDRLRLPEHASRKMAKRLSRHLRRCDGILLSERDRWSGARAEPGYAALGIMRRGIDKALYHPEKRDRARLEQRFGIPQDRPVVAFVGRIDQGKQVMTLIEAVRHLVAKGLDLHLLLIGEGPDRETARCLLGPRVTAPGHVAEDALPWLYASSDLFAFPSRVEVSPNVVLEAKASGLAPVVAPEGGGHLIRTAGVDGHIESRLEARAWADTIEALCCQPALRAAIGRAAREDIERNRPSWSDVLREDLLPIWAAVATKTEAIGQLYAQGTDPHTHPAS